MLEVAGYTADHSGDFFALLDNLLALIHRIAIGQMVPGGIDNSLGDREQVLEIAQKLTAEEVQLYYQIALHGRRDMTLAPDPRMAFEMILMRMVAFKPAQWADNAEGMGESPALSSVAMPAMALTPAEDEKKKTEFSPTAPLICAAPTPAPLQETALPAEFSLLEIDNWHTFFERLNLTGITRNLLANCIVEDIKESHLAILLDVQQSALLNDEHRQRIIQCLRDVLGTHWQISLRIGELTQESPARRKQRIMDERIGKALADFHADPNVRHLVDRFSASVLPESINFISEKRDDRLQ
jgi:DNA polymerase-3 subunit gamma/tau